jgi:acyl-coenzyme A thioesterase PaaI-like protein
MELATSDSRHLIELPPSPLLLNHVGTVHASVLFAIAEACSGEFLLQQLGEEMSADVFAVLRTSEVKFRKPAHAPLRASAQYASADNVGTDSSSGATSLHNELALRGRVLTSVSVAVRDAQEVVAMSGRFDWLLQRQKIASSATTL